MADQDHEFGDGSLGIPGVSDLDTAAQDFGRVSAWDYAGNGLARRPSPSNDWAIHQFLTPNGTYDLGLDASNDSWSDFSISEFLRSPTPISPVGSPCFSLVEHEQGLTMYSASRASRNFRPSVQWTFRKTLLSSCARVVSSLTAAVNLRVSGTFRSLPLILSTGH